MAEKITKKELQAQLKVQQDEIVRLNARTAELQKVENMDTKRAIPSVIGNSAMSYLDQVNKIMRTATVDSNKIKVQEFTDHKNISLWTKYGKRIGPLHQQNALRTLRVFYALGVELITERPTEEQVRDYMKTDEYKKWKADFDEKRKIKEQSRKKGTLEKLTAEIAKLSGQTAEAVTHILKPGNTQDLRDARKNLGIEE